MRREYHYEKFTGNLGAILEIEAALAKANADGFTVETIRMHPGGLPLLMAAMRAGAHVTRFDTQTLFGGGSIVTSYANKWTAELLPIILDAGYPENWFALECQQPASGTEVPELLIGNSCRKIKLS